LSPAALKIKEPLPLLSLAYTSMANGNFMAYRIQTFQTAESSLTLSFGEGSASD
jgi:hypothetical protein